MLHLTVFSTAFRIFFLAAGVHALIAMAIWIAKLRGLDLVEINAAPVFWHTYEMLYGFTRAAIFGFVFTAGQHWVGKYLLGGKSLVILFSLWLLGRFAFFLPPALSNAAFAADLAADIYALAILRVLVNRAQPQNIRVFVLLAFLAVTHFLAVASMKIPALLEYFMPTVRIAAASVAFLVAAIAGRVLPFFAGVVISGEKPHISARVESLIFPLTLVTLLGMFLDVFFAALVPVTAILFAANGLLHSYRWFRWRPYAAMRFPILGILYVSYAWLFIGFGALTLSKLQLLRPDAAWHIVGIGGISIFVFGMITRVALGHTGRPIKAHGAIVLAYVMLNLALFARVIVPLGSNAALGYLLAASLWIFSFAVFLLQYTTILLRPRIDGRPG
jgi:uncharacterized protein involved in response to NO